MIRIVIADDHTLFAKGIEGLLEEHDDLVVLEIFPNGQKLIDYLKTHDVDVVLTDLNMPVLDGFGVLTQIALDPYRAKVIVLSMYDDEKIFKKAIEKGADGFILKDADPDELVYTIREVYEGRHVLNFQSVVEQAQPNSFFDTFRDKYRLSRREVQIVSMIKDGHSSKDIADILGLSPSTIETHRKNIHQKLGVSTRVELVNKAYEMKL